MESCVKICRQSVLRKRRIAPQINKYDGKALENPCFPVVLSGFVVLYCVHMATRISVSASIHYEGGLSVMETIKVGVIKKS